MIQRLLLVPLDERPVNTQLPHQVAGIAGVQLDLPPADCLPSFRRPADVTRLADWVERMAPQVDQALVSLDGYVYGGLIPARTGKEETSESLARLARLAQIRTGTRRAAVRCFSVITRATDSYSRDEEPEYWGEHGRELHALGGDMHRWLVDGSPSRIEVPDAVRSDFWNRRLRNHLLNLEALRLRATGELGSLLLTTDDTATYAAGSAEQIWLRYWRHTLGLDDDVHMYPGADEVGATLVARALLGDDEPVRTAVVWTEDEGRERIASYEDQPMAATVVRQLKAAGAIAVDLDDAEAILVVHPPGPAPADWCGGGVTAPDPDGELAVEELRAVLEGRGTLPVGIADCRQGNGGDPRVLKTIRTIGVEHVAAYGGWNTAGNSLGSTVSSLVATVIGSRHGTFDPRAQRRALLTRLLDDAVYQPTVRTNRGSAANLGITREDVADRPLEHYATAVTRDLQEALAGLDPQARLLRCTLPWKRTFEVDLSIE